jgi:hypothetical protein
MSTCPATRLAWSIWVFSALFGATALVITFLGVPVGLSFLEFGAAFNAAVIAASSRPLALWSPRVVPRLGILTDVYAIYVLFGRLNEPMPGATLSA